MINPIAGMGGRVGLKGTDGVLAEAITRGATPIAQERAKEAVNRYIELIKQSKDFGTEISPCTWLTCAGSMGFKVLEELKLHEQTGDEASIVYESTNIEHTTAKDTITACKRFLESGVELIIFCGGDGTARDVFSVAQDNVPILGIPSGVKMHSGVFATHPQYVGDLLMDYKKGELDTADGEILDLDEDLYRKGEWNIRLFGVAKTPHEPTIIQRGKHMVESATEAEVKEEIAEFIKEEIAEHPDTMFILGSGSTLAAIAKQIGIEGSLLGIDAMYNDKLIGKDLNESGLMELLDTHPKAKLILSPIGAQGFILGRGNLQLSPAVVRRIGIDNLDVVSTPAKLAGIEALKVDTGDHDLDAEFEAKGWLSVIIGYRQMKLKKVSI